MKTPIFKTILLLTALFSTLSLSAAQSDPTPADHESFGVDIDANPHTLNIFSMGDGSVHAYTAVSGNLPVGEELYAGEQFMPAECSDGIYFLVEPDHFFTRNSLIVNNENVTDQVEDGVYHYENVEDDVEVWAVFDVELASLTSLLTDLPAGSYEVYTLQGVQVNPEHLTTGFYLLRHGAQTAKIYVQ